MDPNSYRRALLRGEQPSAVEHFGILRVTARELRHERTFGDSATATGADLLEHALGQLRANPLSRKFLRNLGVKQDDSVALDTVIGNSYGIADNELEAALFRIIDYGMHPHLFSRYVAVGPDKRGRSAVTQTFERQLSAQRHSDASGILARPILQDCCLTATDQWNEIDDAGVRGIESCSLYP
jgi:hypothetical protein